ncbi:MAG TPA: DUF4136 domain-containing protein [Flavisolibacter sp.]|nr:DUF4136 domain-containing protein [Flavisolibacter sp.]
MSILKVFSAAVLSGLLLAGCASVAHVEKDETVNFSKYQTYAWVETSEKKNDSSQAHITDLTERKIREAVSAELAKSGWKESRNKPDVLLSYDVLVERGIRESNNPVYSNPYTRYFFNPYSRRWNAIYYPSQFLGYDNNARAVREGTVTITLVDAKTEKTIWQGWTTDEVNSRNMSAKEIQNSVRSIFRKFDVAKIKME